ncbi:class I SAM-dependent methyltransferase [Funiculus sociatus GB2-A5]|uniref:Class I SAM-dependent methyltransferase n=1 Tax=Funiculus sociatus GB2-A5 TaxID=2933946 RepID=A0ABV0JTG5_9CYAN|nr:MULTISPECIES: class I SAM-dependent methyltransferase [unclassified Trichocoleus]MBD1905968.1 class I SAM-dependent methyltransferase [Trichocoleus sp. FACHB-832]MBD2064839.1 class I SAM-dependent methyltransferase [Trichocoleus sp. FACHB-6]
MELEELKRNWNEFGRRDPLWAILTNPTKKGNKWEPDEFFKTGEEEIESVINYINSLGIAYSRKKALDFGCGVGRLTQALFHYFDEACGIDIAPSMIELARKYNRYGDKCQYYVNESDDLRLFKDNSFNFIYSKIVLQHIRPEYSKNYIKEFLRILTPGGLMVFQIPSEPVPIEYLTTLGDSAYNAQITLLEPLPLLKAGGEATIKVSVKNISDVTWPSLSESQGKYMINLGNHWLNKAGKIIMNDDGRKPLPKSIKPLEEAEISLDITIPGEPGNCLLELDMVHEGVTWFKEKGSQTTRVSVQVEKAFQLKDIGQSILNLYRMVAGINVPKNSSNFFVPTMEMYGIQKDVVLELIDCGGGKLIDVQQDFSVGQGWLSYLYCVIKE